MAEKEKASQEETDYVEGLPAAKRFLSWIKRHRKSVLLTTIAVTLISMVLIVVLVVSVVPNNTPPKNTETQDGTETLLDPYKEWLQETHTKLQEQLDKLNEIFPPKKR